MITAYLPLLGVAIIAFSEGQQLIKSSKYKRKNVDATSWIPSSQVKSVGTITQCGSICSSSKGCSAFQFNKKDQTCSIGSQESLTFAATPSAQDHIHLDAGYVPPDYGYVAFISGGSTSNSAELYSPNGLCSFYPAPMPVPKSRHSLVWRNNEILACAGQEDLDCYTYFISNNSWALYSTATRTYLPHSVYNNKLYFTGVTSQVLDLNTKSWSTWPAAPNNNFAACQVTWGDAFIRFGGRDYPTWIFMFNHTTQNWTKLSEGNPMFDFSGCILLKENKVLLEGSGGSGFQNQYCVYDLAANQWIFFGTLSLTSMRDMGIVMLGTRVFILQGADFFPLINIVQEFHLRDYSITSVPNLLKEVRNAMAAISVPDKLFRNRFPNCLGVS